MCEAVRLSPCKATKGALGGASRLGQNGLGTLNQGVPDLASVTNGVLDQGTPAMNQMTQVANNLGQTATGFLDQAPTVGQGAMQSVGQSLPDLASVTNGMLNQVAPVLNQGLNQGLNQAGTLGTTVQGGATNTLGQVASVDAILTPAATNLVNGLTEFLNQAASSLDTGTMSSLIQAVPAVTNTLNQVISVVSQAARAGTLMTGAVNVISQLITLLNSVTIGGQTATALLIEIANALAEAILTTLSQASEATLQSASTIMNLLVLAFQNAATVILNEIMLGNTFPTLGSIATTVVGEIQSVMSNTVFANDVHALINAATQVVNEIAGTLAQSALGTAG
ncbi:uncharacterized protein LOC135385049 [Ornithodoros turicata]|uniref:uncharacterized protein LOC135385049 n=1 Tax=Ornithodoros turicata TaxID=34597 RepID=UPI0031397284